MFYTKNPINQTISPSNTPIVDPKWHTVIAYCIAPMLWEALGNPDRATTAEQKFEAELQKATDNSSLSDIHPFQRELPSLTQYQ